MLCYLHGPSSPQSIQSTNYDNECIIDRSSLAVATHYISCLLLYICSWNEILTKLQRICTFGLLTTLDLGHSIPITMLQRTTTTTTAAATTMSQRVSIM